MTWVGSLLHAWGLFFVFHTHKYTNTNTHSQTLQSFSWSELSQSTCCFFISVALCLRVSVYRVNIDAVKVEVCVCTTEYVLIPAISRLQNISKGRIYVWLTNDFLLSYCYRFFISVISVIVTYWNRWLIRHVTLRGVLLQRWGATNLVGWFLMCSCCPLIKGGRAKVKVKGYFTCF